MKVSVCMVITVLLEPCLMEELPTVESEISTSCTLMQATVIMLLVFRKFRHEIFDSFKEKCCLIFSLSS